MKEQEKPAQPDPAEQLVPTEGGEESGGLGLLIGMALFLVMVITLVVVLDPR
jgi:hypothetical protein